MHDSGGGRIKLRRGLLFFFLLTPPLLSFLLKFVGEADSMGFREVLGARTFPNPPLDLPLIHDDPVNCFACLLGYGVCILLYHAYGQIW